MAFQAYCFDNSNSSQVYHAFKALVKIFHNLDKERDQQAAELAVIKEKQQGNNCHPKKKARK